MSANLKKNKSIESLINEYMSDIVDTCEKNRATIKRSVKVSDENVIIPTVNNYEILNKYNYNLAQLKKIAKTYKIKISGNKNELSGRVYSYLYFSSFIIKIQKVFRGLLILIISQQFSILSGMKLSSSVTRTNLTSIDLSVVCCI